MAGMVFAQIVARVLAATINNYALRQPGERKASGDGSHASYRRSPLRPGQERYYRT
jgi:hypothetical protein